MVWSNSEMYDGRYDTRYDDNKYKDNEVLGIFSMDDSASLEYNFINFISAKLEIISKLLSRISSEKMKLMWQVQKQRRHLSKRLLNLW